MIGLVEIKSSDSELPVYYHQQITFGFRCWLQNSVMNKTLEGFFKNQ